MIQGKVENISPIALDTACSMDIILTDGVTTTTHKQIPSRPQSSGTAEVLTDDKNILGTPF